MIGLRKLLALLILVGLLSPVGYSQQTRLMSGPNSAVAVGDLSLTFFIIEGKYNRLTKDANGKWGFTPVSLVIINLDGGPSPVPDPDPDPIPDPVPVDPTNPFPLPGLRTLILEETADRGIIDRGQLAVINSGDVQEYLRTHAARDGNTIEWRKLDDDFTEQDLNEAKVSEMWKKAYARALADSDKADGVVDGNRVLPWAIVSNGATFESKPLPKGATAIADFMALLKKYGGN